MFDECTKLGKFSIPITKAKAFTIDVLVTFKVDQSGNLTCTAEEKQSGQKKSVTFER